MGITGAAKEQSLEKTATFHCLFAGLLFLFSYQNKAKPEHPINRKSF